MQLARLAVLQEFSERVLTLSLPYDDNRALLDDDVNRRAFVQLDLCCKRCGNANGEAVRCSTASTNVVVEVARRKDGYPLIVSQCQQLFVTGNQAVGLARNCSTQYG